MPVELLGFAIFAGSTLLFISLTFSILERRIQAIEHLLMFDEHDD
jgi:hypothetical protein